MINTPTGGVHESSKDNPNIIASKIQDTESNVLEILTNNTKNISIGDLYDLKKGGEIILFHGGLPGDATMDDIDLNRVGIKQRYGDKDYGGFYLTDEISKKWSEYYAQSSNGNLHGFLLAEDLKILEITESHIDRISIIDLQEYAKEYDIIKGKDLIGRNQYILLNKDKVVAMGKDNLEVYPDLK